MVRGVWCVILPLETVRLIDGHTVRGVRETKIREKSEKTCFSKKRRNIQRRATLEPLKRSSLFLNTAEWQARTCLLLHTRVFVSPLHRQTALPLHPDRE